MAALIRPEALTRLRLLVGAVRPPLVASDTTRELPPLQAGQPIDGRVDEPTRTGYIVSVGGRSFEIKLPEGTRTGDLLRMVYVSDDPRPTFALLRIDRGGEPPASRLSDAGKLLSMLQEFETASGKPAVGESAPVFPARMPETLPAATLLREALALSGLFYESHQAEWVLGTRSTAQLQREPQGRLTPLPARSASEGTEALPLAHADHADSPEAAGRRPETGAEDPLVPMRELPQRNQSGAPALESAGRNDPADAGQAARSPAHPDSYPIIRQQLNALETGLVEWRGMIWPGQALEWQVSERHGESGNPQEAAAQGGATPRTWRTELRLRLPNVGQIVARIELDAQGAKLRVVSDSAQQARQLRVEAPVLAHRLGAAGINVNAFEVGIGDEAA